MNNALTNKNRLHELFPAHLSDFDSLINQVLSPTSVRVGHTSAGFWEDNDAYHVEVDVPGVAREDVEITLDKGTLSLNIERKHAEESETRKGWREERFYGKVSRAFTLPETIDSESVEASLDKGVLRVTVAKSPTAQPRKIEVK